MTDPLPRIYRHALILGVLFILTGLLFWGWQMALSILIGSLLALLNFGWLVSGVEQAMDRGPGRGSGRAVVKYAARLLLIFLTFFAIIHTSFLSVLGALVGLSLFVAAGMLEALLLLFKVR